MNQATRSVGVLDVDQQKLVHYLALFLKRSGKIKQPEWVDIVKTGVNKELPPFNEDWFYIRCASIARHIYMRSPVGVGKLTKIYGGRYRRGTRPSHFVKAGSSIARKALQALESIKWVEPHANGGRKITAQGRRDLDRISAQLRAKMKLRAAREALLAAETA